MRTIMSKSRYAKSKGRSLSALSHWIATGKISRAALLGEGVRARIWVEQADANLERNLDPNQQYYQEYWGKQPANRKCI